MPYDFYSTYNITPSQRRGAVTTPSAPSWETQTGLQNLVQGYNVAYEQARRANEQRYQQLLSGADESIAQRQVAGQEMLGTLGDISQQEAADIRSEYGQQRSNIMQQLARQGMGGTTVAPTMGLGVQREQSAALNRLADAFARTKLGVQAQEASAMDQLRQQRLGIIERREDRYPDLSSLQSIIAGVGAQYGGGMGIPTMLSALAGIRQ